MLHHDQLQLSRTSFNRHEYGSLKLLFSLDREGIIQNIGKFRIENGDNPEVKLISKLILMITALFNFSVLISNVRAYKAAPIE